MRQTNKCKNWRKDKQRNDTGGNETYTHTDIQTNVKMEEEINRGNEPECIKAHICFSAILPPTYYMEWVAPLLFPPRN